MGKIGVKLFNFEQGWQDEDVYFLEEDNVQAIINLLREKYSLEEYPIILSTFKRTLSPEMKIGENIDEGCVVCWSFEQPYGSVLEAQSAVFQVFAEHALLHIEKYHRNWEALIPENLGAGIFKNCIKTRGGKEEKYKVFILPSIGYPEVPPCVMINPPLNHQCVDTVTGRIHFQDEDFNRAWKQVRYTENPLSMIVTMLKEQFQLI